MTSIVKYQIVELLKELHNGTNYTLIDKNKIPNSLQGNEYTMSFWIYIRDYNYRHGNTKSVMYRGDRENIHSNPDIFLLPLNNSMVFRFELQNETLHSDNIRAKLIPNNNNNTVNNNIKSSTSQWDKVRYLKITQDNRNSSRDDNDKILSLTQIEIYDVNNNNVALGKPTSQSSVSENMDSSKVVDGNLDGTQFSMTNPSDVNWLEIDLTSTIDLSKVIIYNRSDCCSDRLDGVHITLMNNERNVIYDSNYGSHNSEIIEGNRRYKVFNLEDFNKTQSSMDNNTTQSTMDNLVNIDELGIETFQNFLGFHKDKFNMYSNISGNFVDIETFEDINQNSNSVLITNTPMPIPPEIPNEETIGSLDTRLDKVELQLQKLNQKGDEPLNTKISCNSQSQLIDNQEKIDITYDECHVNDIPLQKWTHIALSLFNNNSDIYIDGKLRKSCFLKGYPKPNQSDLHITANGGFNGFLSNIKYANIALQQNDIYKLYQEGPQYTHTLWNKVKDVGHSISNVLVPE